jgi:hypothetical protein
MAYTGSTAAILSNYDEVLKTFYLPAIQEQLNNENFLSDIILTNEEDVSGKNATIECHYGRNGASGARADGGTLPDADYQKFKTATIPMKYNYHRITMSGPTIAATRDQKGAYARVLDTEITGAVVDFRKDLNRQLWGAGYGILGRWRSTASGTSYTLQKLYRGNSVGGDAFGSTFGAKYLSEDGRAVPVVQTFSSGATASTVDATNIAVTAITEGTDYDTITCTDPSVTEAAGTFYIRPGNMVSLTSASAAGAGRLEMMGLRGLVTNTNLDDISFTDGTASNTGFAAASAPAVDTLQGLNVDTYTWWKSQVDSHASGRYAGQRALTLNLMQKMFDKVEIAVGMGQGPNVILTTHALRREYLDLMQADRRSVNTMSLDGGWQALDYNGVPLMVDTDAIDGEMYFLTTQYLNIFRMSDFEWMQKDGAILARITGYDAYEAVLFRYAELGCKRRNAQGVLTDLMYEN